MNQPNQDKVTRVDWIHLQLVAIAKARDEPEMKALIENHAGLALFEMTMAERFPEFSTRYPKIFRRAVNNNLNTDLMMIAMKHKSKADSGEMTYQKASLEAYAHAMQQYAPPALVDAAKRYVEENNPELKD